MTSPTTSSPTRDTGRPTARKPKPPKKSSCCGSTPTRRTCAGRHSSPSGTPSPPIWRSHGRHPHSSIATAWIYRLHRCTGNPAPEEQYDRAIVPDGRPGAGGSFCIAQRWVHDLQYFAGLSSKDQENTFGRTKADSTRLATQVPTSHLAHLRGARARAAMTLNPSVAKWCAARRRTHSTTALSACTSWAFAGSRRPCENAWKPSSRPTARRRHRLLDTCVGLDCFAPSVETLDRMLT